MSLSSSAGGPSVPSPEPFYLPAGSAHTEGSSFKVLCPVWNTNMDGGSRAG